MAERPALGGYLLGGYPQLLPTIYSVFYKVSGTYLDGFPVEDSPLIFRLETGGTTPVRVQHVRMLTSVRSD
jgi:hypothetical protein